MMLMKDFGETELNSYYDLVKLNNELADNYKTELMNMDGEQLYNAINLISKSGLEDIYYPLYFDNENFPNILAETDMTAKQRLRINLAIQMGITYLTLLKQGTAIISALSFSKLVNLTEKDDLIKSIDNWINAFVGIVNPSSVDLITKLSTIKNELNNKKYTYASASDGRRRSRRKSKKRSIKKRSDGKRRKTKRSKRSSKKRSTKRRSADGKRRKSRRSKKRSSRRRY